MKWVNEPTWLNINWNCVRRQFRTQPNIWDGAFSQNSLGWTSLMFDRVLDTPLMREVLSLLIVYLLIYLIQDNNFRQRLLRVFLSDLDVLNMSMWMHVGFWLLIEKKLIFSVSVSFKIKVTTYLARLTVN